MRLCHLDTDAWRKTCMLWYPHTNIPLFTPLPPPTVFIIMDGVREQCEDFYHSCSLKQQPSVKCARSPLVSVGVIVKCYTCAHTCIWIGPSKVWMNVHHVNKTDDINSSAQSHSYRIMDLAFQMKYIMMNVANIRLMILVLIALQQLFTKDLMVWHGLAWRPYSY